MAENELIEALAEQEHASWARWMAYLFSKCQRGRDGSMTMPADYVRHWEREVSTPYAALSDAAKQSDREEVAHILPIIRQAAQPAEPRAIVRAFALAMERKLAANDATKGGWRDDDWFTLHRSLMIETRELLDALNDLLHVEMGQSPIAREDAIASVLAEAADVSNFAMCIADACDALPVTDERGR